MHTRRGPCSFFVKGELGNETGGSIPRGRTRKKDKSGQKRKRGEKMEPRGKENERERNVDGVTWRKRKKFGRGT